jgi:lipid II:glycine glycyltransferase (peptidoglycan interpeptide bridge formation enzyme)
MPSDNFNQFTTSHFEPYFLQFQDWTSFWQRVNGGDHKVFSFKVSSNEFSLSTMVYQYPWYFGQKFWYIAKGGVLKNLNSGQINNWQNVSEQDLEKMFWELNQKIYNQAKLHSICYIKADWEEGLTNRLKLTSNLDFLNLYKTKYSGAKISNKIIQYLQTMTLDMILIPQENAFDLSQLPEFYEYSKLLWNTTNSNVKRYTKKSLSLDWLISVEKSDENFEAFWQVYSATKDRQAFVTQTKEYTRQLFDQDFSRIIILRNSAGEPCCVWQGIVFGNTFVYLSGGNNQYSFDNYGQYLMHLVAIWMGYSEKLEVYDLGGYDKTKGFGRFKENYKGQIRTFLGDVDIPVNRFKFSIIDGGIELVKKLRE